MFCSRCGEELSETANFCLKCGVITYKGVEDGASYPWNWEKVVERTLTTVVEEVRGAVDTVKESLQKTMKKETTICPSCGSTNRVNSSFCYKCGKTLT